MTAPAPFPPSPADPVLRDALVELVGLGMRIARVAADVAEAEGRVVAVVAAGLPESVDAGSLAEAQAAGRAVDAAGLALAQASPRIGEAARAYDRAARAVRRLAALVQRLDCGWRPRGGADDHPAMVRRQAAREVGERIARRAEGEAAERLFDDLAERLDALEDEGGLDRPAEAVIAALCRDLELEPSASEDSAAPPRAPPSPRPSPAGGRGSG